MRLLFVCPNLIAGGAERQWSILVPRLQAAGFDVRVLTLDREGAFFPPLVAAGIPTYCAHMSSRSDLAGLVRATRFAVSIRPDVIVTRGLSAQLVGHVLARAVGAVHVTTEHRLHDYGGHREPLTQLLAPRIDWVLGVTQSQRSACEGFGYRRERVRVIENGVSSPDVPEDRGELRRELELAPDAFVAVLVAALRPEKLVADFVHGVQEAHSIDARIEGLVVGDGPLRAEAAAEVARAPGVRLVGFRDDVPRLMSAADVVCLTSRMEALPMVLIEAMALSRPTIATNVGGVPDVVVDGVTGALIPVHAPGALAAQLIALASDPALGTEQGAAGKRRHEEFFTADRMVDRHIEFFDSLRPTGTLGGGRT